MTHGGKHQMKAFMIAAVVATSAGLAQAGETKARDTKPMEMKDMSPSGMAKDAKTARHTAKGTVKKVDRPARSVTLAHEPVKSLDWPAMTMAFKVQDPGLFDKLGEGKKVEFQFEQRGRDYVITGVK
ncbi:MAG TPA: copper-binding protein [Burkholderiales bacterium]|nr:copper-binding protein [Burkholderiales bacterium]